MGVYNCFIYNCFTPCADIPVSNMLPIAFAASAMPSTNHSTGKTATGFIPCSAVIFLSQASCSSSDVSLQLNPNGSIQLIVDIESEYIGSD